MDCGAFPLFEVEGGHRWTINQPRPTRPVAEYLALQRRYRHAGEAQVRALQAEVDEAWARLERKAGIG